MNLRNVACWTKFGMMGMTLGLLGYLDAATTQAAITPNRAFLLTTPSCSRKQKCRFGARPMRPKQSPCDSPAKKWRPRRSKAWRVESRRWPPVVRIR